MTELELLRRDLELAFQRIDEVRGQVGSQERKVFELFDKTADALRGMCKMNCHKRSSRVESIWLLSILSLIMSVVAILKVIAR